MPAARNNRTEQVDPGRGPLPRPPGGPIACAVGDFVWAKSKGKNLRVILARVESLEPVPGFDGWRWIRCYHSTEKRKVRTGRKRAGGWSTERVARPIVDALTPAEIANLRKQGVIPADGEVLR